LAWKDTEGWSPKDEEAWVERRAIVCLSRVVKFAADVIAKTENNVTLRIIMALEMELKIRQMLYVVEESWKDIGNWVVNQERFCFAGVMTLPIKESADPHVDYLELFPQHLVFRELDDDPNLAGYASQNHLAVAVVLLLAISEQFPNASESLQRNWCHFGRIMEFAKEWKPRSHPETANARAKTRYNTNSSQRRTNYSKRGPVLENYRKHHFRKPSISSFGTICPIIRQNIAKNRTKNVTVRGSAALLTRNYPEISPRLHLDFLALTGVSKEVSHFTACFCCFR